MNEKTKALMTIGILAALLLIPSIPAQQTDSTSLEITDMKGGFGGIIVVWKTLVRLLQMTYGSSQQ